MKKIWYLLSLSIICVFTSSCKFVDKIFDFIEQNIPYGNKVLVNCCEETPKSLRYLIPKNKPAIGNSTYTDATSSYRHPLKIVESGKLVVGYTIFAPIAYEDDGELIGFDTELAKAVGEMLGLEVVFQVINWDTKVFELESKAIDVIWNGMTITDKIKEETSVTIPYLKNKQVAVIRVEDKDKYKTTEDMFDAVICVESGSAGQLCVEVEE